MICEDCGGEVRVGDWPFCHGDPAKHTHVERFGDDPIQPYFDEHITPGGAYITSRGQRRAIMARQHLDYHDVSKKKRGKVYVSLGG